MKLSSHGVFFGALLTVLCLTGCSDDDENPNPEPTPSPSEWIKVGSASTDLGGMDVSVYATDSLYVRYTPLIIEIHDRETESVLTQATIQLVPKMDMGTMVHSAPVENPTDNYAEDGKFKGAAIFTMASASAWTLEVEIFDPVGDRLEVAAVPLNVRQLDPPRVLSREALDGSDPLILSLVAPDKPEVGENEMELTIHRKESMMVYPAAENLSVSIEPHMPSMGHGSPNNVDPAHMEKGHYVGSVNFTMTGTWVVDVDVYDGNTPLDTTMSFEIVVP